MANTMEKDQDTQEIVANSSLSEIALLFATNTFGIDFSELYYFLLPVQQKMTGQKQYRVIFSKEGYIWAHAASMIISIIYNKGLDIDYTKIKYILNKIILKNSNDILGIYSEMMIDPILYEITIDNIIREIIIEITGEDIPLKTIEYQSNETFTRLIELDYICDPVDIQISSIILIGISLLPISWNKTTDKGRIKKLEIKSILWRYQKNKLDNKATTSVNIEIQKVVDLIILMGHFCVEIPKEISKILNPPRKK